MAPTSGGQYHWVSEFSPRSIQKPLSYFSGWMSTLSWVAGTAGASFMLGLLTTSILVAYRPSYSPERYQTTLFAFASALIQVLANTVCASQLPRFQKLMMIPHGLGWIPVLIVLWTLAPHGRAKDVFTTFSSNGGWGDMGLSVMVGQITSVYFLICGSSYQHARLLRDQLTKAGSDSAAHLSEEVKDAATSIPRAMIWSFFLNGILGFAMLITLLFCIPDISIILDPELNPSGFPVVYVFQQASYYGSVPLLVILQITVIAGAIDSNCSTSRQIFAFARDGGLPFKSVLTMVSSGTRIGLVTSPC